MTRKFPTMTDHPIRPFASADATRRIGTGLLDRSLPREDWTHEAHLAACAWLLLERPDVEPERDLPGIIRAFNTAKGGINDATQGYHETLTQLYIRGVRRFLEESAASDLLATVNALLASEVAPRDWPLRHYSRDLLFSPRARLGWCEPDLSPF